MAEPLYPAVRGGIASSPALVSPRIRLSLTFEPNARILLAKQIERQVFRMFRHVFSVSALALIVGCNGTNPFFDTAASTPDVIGDVELPPEVEQPPTATPGSILR